MNEQSVVDISGLDRKRRARAHPKGRPVEPQALAEIRALLGEAPRRRDLLIEFLHRIQDRYGHISGAHIVALAEEMKLARTEVYEVATFYHHFDVGAAGEAPPPALTVRVCETLSCQMAGADALLGALRQSSASGVRVIGAPCIGRCEHAPAAVVGRHPVDEATPEKIAAAIAGRRTEAEPPPYTSLDAYRAAGGYRTVAGCIGGERTVEAVTAALDESGLRGLGGAG
jgi:NADH:ubiquinone oxidoreductase subunit E